MSNINRVNITELQKLKGTDYSGAALKSAIYAAGASYREAKDLFSGANVWENFKLELAKENPKMEQQAKRKWKLAVDTATEIGLKVLRNNWNDRKDLNLGLSFEDLPKGTAGLTLLKKNYHEEDPISEIPTKEDVERVLRPFRGEATEDVFKAAVVVDFAKKGRTLKPNWWEITKINFVEWSKKR